MISLFSSVWHVATTAVQLSLQHEKLPRPTFFDMLRKIKQILWCWWPIIYNCFWPGSWTSGFSLKETVKSPGPLLGADLQFDTHSFQVRFISKVKAFHSPNEPEITVHAFISSRLDYCIALYSGVNQSSFSRLQVVQKAAAHQITNTKISDHITPVLASRHWLPVWNRIHFNLLTFVFKDLNGLALTYFLFYSEGESELWSTECWFDI